MGISKFNPEGYHDPTAHEALTSIEVEQLEARWRETTLSQRVYRPLVYICSPYSGDIANNEQKARMYSRFAVQQGAIPITPHLLYPQFLNDDNPSERELGMFFGMVLLTKCEQVWVFGNVISSGMDKEIRKAKSKGIQVRYFAEECAEAK